MINWYFWNIITYYVFKRSLIWNNPINVCWKNKWINGMGLWLITSTEKKQVYYQSIYLSTQTCLYIYKYIYKHLNNHYICKPISRKQVIIYIVKRITSQCLCCYSLYNAGNLAFLSKLTHQSVSTSLHYNHLWSSLHHDLLRNALRSFWETSTTIWNDSEKCLPSCIQLNQSAVSEYVHVESQTTNIQLQYELLFHSI